MASMHEFGPGAEELAQSMFAWTVERLRSEPALRPPPEPAVLRSAIGPIADEGLRPAEVMALWEERIAPATLPVDHPRHMAFIPGAPTPAATLADVMISAQSAYAGSWLEAAGAIQAENRVLEWLAGLAGFPEGAGGCFVAGGTAGNLSALVAARSAARRTGRPAGPVIISSETHSSVRYAVERVMGDEVAVAPTDGLGRLTGAALASTIAELGARAVTPYAVVASAGATNLGTIDELDAIAAQCEAHGLWLHVDGAYGGAGLVAPSARPRFAGIERADSMIVDPHKWLFAPYDSCALLYREPAEGRRAHQQHADYLDIVDEERLWNPSEYGVHLSRRPRGLPLWFSLVANGAAAYRDAIESTLAVAAYAAKSIAGHSHLELIAEPELSVVAFFRDGWDEAAYGRWCDDLLARGIAFVAPTRHAGRPCCRLAIVNPRTTPGDVDLILETTSDWSEA